MNIKQYIKANGCTEEEAQGLLKADPCALCYLNKNPYGKDVKGWGSTAPTFMVVSDYIRKGWISTGFKPFCGPLYTLLNKMMTEVGIDQKDVYYTSLVKCPTATSLKKGEDGKLKKEAVDYCSCKLEQEITQLKPKVIIACGQDALSYFFPNYKMAEKRCQILNDPKHNCVVIPIYNPEIMVTTAEFDRIIQKAFEQAYNYLYNKQKLACTEKLNYKRVMSLEMLKAVLNRVKEVDAFAYDVEASSLNPREAKLLSIGISWKVNTGVAFPIYIADNKEINKRLNLALAEIGKAKTTEEKKKAKESFNKLEKEIGANPPLISFWGDHHAEVMDIVKQIFDAPCKKGGHNIDYDNKVLYYNGIKVNHVTFDTMLMHHMLDEERPKELDYLSWVDTDKGGYKMAKEEYLDTIKKSYAHIPLDVLLDYNAGDADTTFELYLKYKPLLIQEGMAKEFATVRMPLLVELINVSITGMKIDRNYIDTVRVELLNKISDCENKLKEFLKGFYPNVKIIKDSKEKGSEAGVTYFNIKSSADLSDLIYNKMKVKATILTESGKPSTNEAALIKLSKKYPILSAILEHRKNTKFYDTYIKDMPSYMDKDDRVHANFKIATAVTGRMSVTDPALQTIPRDSTVKKMFVPEKGYGIMEVDFSQQELRCLAYLSNDTAMCRAYSQGKDLHMELAKSIFNKEEQDVTKEERTMAKCCFDEDSLILTTKGYVKAKDLGNAKLLTLDGKQQNQYHIFEKQKGYLISLSNGQQIKVTQNHKFQFFDKLQPRWVEANSLKVGDILGTCKTIAFGDYMSFHVGEGLRTKTYIQDFVFDEDMAYTMGLYLSDGSICKTKTRKGSTMSIITKPENEHIVYKALNKFGLKFRTYKNKRYKLAYIATRALADWVESNFGKGKEKRIPLFIYNCPESVVKSFLSGLLDSDSYITQRIRFINTNENLVRQVSRLGTLLGYEMSFHGSPYHTKIKGKEYKGILYISTFISKPDVHLYVKKDTFNDRITTNYWFSGWKIDRSEFKDNKYNGKYNYNINNYRKGNANIMSVKAVNDLGLPHKNYNPVTIIDIKPIEVNACVMETDTHYFIGEGMESHNCNFLQAYGGGPSVLCENLEKMGVVISEAKARKIIDGWNKKFSGAVTFLNSQVNFFINHGYLQTPAGLKKHLYRVFTDNYIMEGKKRQARNFPIQAYCSSITFYSLLTIIRKLREQGLKSRVISTVHDSILIEVKFGELEQVLKIAKEATWITMPGFNGHCLKADVAYSTKSWGDKKDIEWDTKE